MLVSFVAKPTILITQQTHVPHECPMVLKGPRCASAVKSAWIIIKKALKGPQLSHIGLHVKAVR